MVFPNKATKTVIDKFPNLKKSIYWKGCYLFVDYNGKENLECCGIIAALSMYVRDILSKTLSNEKQQEIKDIFSLIEFFMNEGNQEV
jgi:hypothetical protein